MPRDVFDSVLLWLMFFSIEVEPTVVEEPMEVDKQPMEAETQPKLSEDQQPAGVYVLKIIVKKKNKKKTYISRSTQLRSG